jgi:hypothetical protein
MCRTLRDPAVPHLDIQIVESKPFDNLLNVVFYYHKTTLRQWKDLGVHHSKPQNLLFNFLPFAHGSESIGPLSSEILIQQGDASDLDIAR